MRVALVHDYLNQLGGGERVLKVFLGLFPRADLYTLLYDPVRTRGRFEGRAVRTSFLDFPLARRSHRPFIPLMPLAISSIELRGYDLIISDTAGYAKGVSYARRGDRPFHLSYCYTPIRYAWEPADHFRRPLFAALGAPAFAYLRAWDRRAAQRPDTILAISSHIRERIRQCYGRDAAVLYPPLRQIFSHDPAAPRGDYYLAVGRLLHYKRFDIAIEACAAAGRPLVVAGTGPELKRLKATSDPSTRLRAGKARGEVTFLEFVPDDEKLRDLYRSARALIFPQVEDFGLVAAEAIACGTPVLAFRGGGAPEIVREGTSGLLVSDQTAAAFADAIREFEAREWRRAAIAAEAARFSEEAFIRGFLAALPPEFREVTPHAALTISYSSSEVEKIPYGRFSTPRSLP